MTGGLSREKGAPVGFPGPGETRTVAKCTAVPRQGAEDQGTQNHLELLCLDSDTQNFPTRTALGFVCM